MSVPFPPHRRIPSAEAIAAASLPRRVRDALEATHAAVYELVVDPLDRVLPHLDNRFGHNMRDTGARPALTPDLIEQTQLLARRQATFIAQFARNVDVELAGLRTVARQQHRTPDARPLMPTFEELRLVEHDEANEETELKAIAMRQESRAPLPIHLLCQRFAVLAESPAYEPGRLPVGPRRLCELMLAAAEANGFGLGLRVMLLREFDRLVLGEYPAVAESINDLLMRQRIMPGLSFVPLRPRARVAPPSDASLAAERERPHTGWTGAAPSDADAPTFQMLQDLLASRRSMADRFRTGFMPGEEGGAPGASDAGSNTGAGGRGGFAGATGSGGAGGGNALAGFAGGDGSFGGGDAVAGGAGNRPLSTRPELPTQIALELLASAGDDVAGLDVDGIRQWLLLHARQRQGEAVALSREDADIFELLSLMNSHLEREVRPDSPAKAMLDRLHLPLLRLALADPGFFLRAAHPAREVLNAVAESGARWYAPDDIDPQLLLHLERIVDAIARAPSDVAGAFRSGLNALEQQQQAVARRSEIAERRNVEAARGKDKLAVARRRAGDVIDTALKSTKLPAFHRGMLRHAWADVLTLAHLRRGEESGEWTSLIEATDELVAAAAGKASAGPDLVLLVDQWLSTVGYHADDAARIARILTGTEDANGDDAATRTELTMRLKSRARLGEDTDMDGDGGEPLDADAEAQARRVRELPPGAWFDLPGERGAVMRRRLSWLSEVTGQTLFVNPRGQRVADGRLDALARDLAAGGAQVVTAGEGRLIDRAWRAALQALGTSQAPVRPRERTA
ncbi:DUF1631 family protein [Lysobacter sp. TY2-98]|uniref:DUF1631 family protein n=1 Tax=Lysobacter sp. TY2-98 TaxID=2290922 RepID=UPI000E202049|nr:DUF1631 family protein [Lysobacter sp. TY2-98]AXK71121.1 DUF1631 family protein [Lysobacter sp. TY2-98]